MIVADTNLIAYFFLKCEYTSIAEEVFKADQDWISPGLWRSEFCNVLSLYIRQKHINLEKAIDVMLFAERLVVEYEVARLHKKILELAVNSNCATYDCEFVALADKLGVYLITFDKKILKSFNNIAISPEKFLTL